MAWANAGKFRNVNPALRITPGNAGTLLTLYQPGVLNPSTRDPNVTYSGLITNLRAKIAISSLIQSYRMPSGPNDDLEAYALALEDYENTVPRKSLMILLSTATTSPVVIAHLHLFKRTPFYIIDLMAYLTNTITLDLGSDAKLLVKTADVGYGDLFYNDEVVIWGSAIEEQENAQPQNIIVNNYVTGGVGGGSGTNPSLGDTLGYESSVLTVGGSVLRP